MRRPDHLRGKAAALGCLVLLSLFELCRPATAQSVEPGFGLPEPHLDFRTMLRRHVLRRSAEVLDAAAARREAAIAAGDINRFRDEIRRNLAAVIGDLPTGKRGCPLNVRSVSRHERKHYCIENVLFESLPGWDVNATVYLPRPEVFPPPWPAIVIPVGHSGKQFESYQVPAQVFARSGYVAVTFDPPGQSGEKRTGNDHFVDGVRCHLTGSTSQRFFVLDALRTIDYLETRPDVDMRRGVAMTGVSGGGFTTLYACPLDKRITVAGPSCFAGPELDHPLRDGYPACPESLSPDLYPRGLDAINLLIAASPTPLLAMAGKNDEVFKASWMQQMANMAARGYRAAGTPERFRFFLDSGGHEYSVAQALEFAGWADRWLRGDPSRHTAKAPIEDLEMVPYEALRCYPRPAENMLTVQRGIMNRLARQRTGTDLRRAAMQVARIDPDKPPNLLPRDVSSSAPFLVWTDHLEELLFRVDRDIELPATLLYAVKPLARQGGILYFDDRGRWTELAGGRTLSRMAHFLEPTGQKPTILTVDLRGWGDTRPAFSPFDSVSWASPQRSLAYVSAALGDAVLAMRIRDGVAALSYLRSRPEVDPKRIVVGGHGMGAVVALHVAAIDAGVCGVFAEDLPASFQMIANAERYDWSPDDLLPGVLRFYDLPELATSLGKPVLIINPRDALYLPLTQRDATQLYSSGKSSNNVSVRSEVEPGEGRALQIRWVAEWPRRPAPAR